MISVVTNIETIQRRRKAKGLRELTSEEIKEIFETGIYIPPEARSDASIQTQLTSIQGGHAA